MELSTGRWLAHWIRTRGAARIACATGVAMVMGTGCNNGWGSLEEKAALLCAGTVNVKKAYLAQAVSTGLTENHLAGQGFLINNEGALLAACTKSVAQGLMPCVEYKYETASSLGCIDARVPALLEGALMDDCLAGKPYFAAICGAQSTFVAKPSCAVNPSQPGC